MCLKHSVDKGKEYCYQTTEARKKMMTSELWLSARGATASPQGWCGGVTVECQTLLAATAAQVITPHCPHHQPANLVPTKQH